MPDNFREGSANPARDAARLLRQRLELNRGFGWDMPIELAPRAMADSAAPSASEGAAPSASEGTVVSQAEVAESGEGREAVLEAIRAEVADCRLCGLCEGRTNTVFGVGNHQARILFVGEGPGRDEDLAGEPFVGQAGKLLDKIIQAMGLERREVYIANIVKCRPPENRNPATEEMAACFPYLKRQIEVIQPEVICALGGVAAKALLSTDLSVGRLRGEFHQFADIPVRVTYHPAYLLRSPGEKKKTWEDIKALMGLIDLQPPT